MSLLAILLVVVVLGALGAGIAALVVWANSSKRKDDL